jgi:hypothetical protein
MSAPGWNAATRTCARPNRSRSACSSSPARAVWSCTRISTMPCARAAVSIRDTLDRLVPMTRAMSSWERPSRKYIRAALISDIRSRGAGIVTQVLVNHWREHG